MSKLYNRSTGFIEKAEVKPCKACNQQGTGQDGYSNCIYCNGYGELWISESGWTRAKYRPVEETLLY